MRGLIGKKIGMTQIFQDGGQAVPVTVVEAGPCVVTQVKTLINDGYDAVQVGFGEKKLKHSNKALNGHFKKSGADIKRFLAEFVPVPGADRLHLGMPNLLGLAATRPGLEILHELGLETVEAHVLDLSGYCITQLRERGLTVVTPFEEKDRAGIVSIQMKSDEDALKADEFLTGQGVDAYHAEGILRVDPHVFNNRDDIDKFLSGLDDYLKL